MTGLRVARSVLNASTFAVSPSVFWCWIIACPFRNLHASPTRTRTGAPPDIYTIRLHRFHSFPPYLLVPFSPTSINRREKLLIDTFTVATPSKTQTIVKLVTISEAATYLLGSHSVPSAHGMCWVVHPPSSSFVHQRFLQGGCKKQNNSSKSNSRAYFHKITINVHRIEPFLNSNSHCLFTSNFSPGKGWRVFVK